MSFKIAATVSAVAMLAGCATIFTGANQDIDIASSPDGATVTIVNSGGATVFSGVTPTEAQLARGEGFFDAEKYTVTISKEGYPEQTVYLNSTANGWTFANLILGGVVGILIDGATGAIYSYKPKDINVTLGTEASLEIRTVDQLSELERQSLTPIG